jgi:hypothetical protein
MRLCAHKIGHLRGRRNRVELHSSCVVLAALSLDPILSLFVPKIQEIGVFYPGIIKLALPLWPMRCC